jgi:transcriptional regulator with XRE-family HTH domain
MKLKPEQKNLLFSTRLVLTALLKQSDLTQDAISKKTGLTASTVSRIIRGVSPIALDELSAIANAFGYNTSDVLLIAEKIERKMDSRLLSALPNTNPQELLKSAENLCHLLQEEHLATEIKTVFQFLHKEQTNAVTIPLP